MYDNNSTLVKCTINMYMCDKPMKKLIIILGACIFAFVATLANAAHVEYCGMFTHGILGAQCAPTTKNHNGKATQIRFHRKSYK